MTTREERTYLFECRVHAVATAIAGGMGLHASDKCKELAAGAMTIVKAVDEACRVERQRTITLDEVRTLAAEALGLGDAGEAIHVEEDTGRSWSTIRSRLAGPRPSESE